MDNTKQSKLVRTMVGLQKTSRQETVEIMVESLRCLGWTPEQISKALTAALNEMDRLGCR